MQAASSRVPLGRCELGAGTSEVRVCGFLLASGWPVVEVGENRGLLAAFSDFIGSLGRSPCPVLLVTVSGAPAGMMAGACCGSVGVFAAGNRAWGSRDGRCFCGDLEVVQWDWLGRCWPVLGVSCGPGRRSL